MGKKILSIILVLSLFAALLTGCAKDKETAEQGNNASTQTPNSSGTGDDETFNGIDISKPITLKMYLLGDRTADFDKVYEEINKILKEKVNATVEVEFLSWSEHDTKYSLLFAGAEDFDLIFTASGWAHYETTVAMGGFYPLSQDFIKTYAPDIWDVVPEMAWSQAEIDGSPYMVPNYQNEFGANVVAVRGDLMDKYGYTDITGWDDLIAFYRDIAANESTISPLGTQGGGLLYSYLLDQKLDIIGGAPGELFIYNCLSPEDLSIAYSLDSEVFTNYFKLAKEMYDKGFWSADSLATTEERQDGFLNGTAASMIWNLGTAKYYAKQANKEHPEWKCTVIDVSPNVQKAVNPYINNGVAINASSKNKERAMMVLNEFYTNKEIQDLTSLGIEGVHWEAAGDREYKLLDGNSNYGVDNNCNWGWINTDIKRKEFIENPDEVDKKTEAILASWNGDIKVEHPYDGFSFNNANVNSEKAAVDTVISQYYTPLMLGMAGDVDTALSELRKQLDKAGIQTIYDEIKKQADEYVAR